jgi:hypothetical protein
MIATVTFARSKQAQINHSLVQHHGFFFFTTPHHHGQHSQANFAGHARCPSKPQSFPGFQEDIETGFGLWSKHCYGDSQRSSLGFAYLVPEATGQEASAGQYHWNDAE